MEDETTTMNIKRSTLKRLRKYEIHPRQTHEEIIVKLLEEVKKNEKENKKLV